MSRRDFIRHDGVRCVYQGRMRRAPGGPFVTHAETAANIALAHRLFGTPADAWHPDIIFGEPHDVSGFLFELLFFGVNQLVDVWVAAR